MRKDDWVRMRHMLDAAKEAVSFTRNKTRSDLDTVWDTIKDDLPPLIAQLEKVMTSDLPDQ